MSYLKYYWNKLRFKLKRHVSEVLRSETSDKSIALGFSIGTFIAILPTPGISILLGFGVIAIFKRINKLSLFLAMALWNAITLIPVYWLSSIIGQWIFREANVVYIDLGIIDQVRRFTLRFLEGDLILSIPTSISRFFAVRYLLRFSRISEI